jgi:hypothetical protein
MPRRTQNFTLVLALVAMALLAFTTTVELLPHHHDNINERVCPLCHAPLASLQPAALKLPSPTKRFWVVNIPAFSSVVESPICHASPRGPPAW